MAIAKIRILDEVNSVITGLDPDTFKKVQNVLTFYVPGFVHMPLYKLGRWDGRIKLVTANCGLPINLVPYIVDILTENGYELKIIEDNRSDYSEDLKKIDLIDRNSFNHILLEKKPLLLWEHQKDAVNRALQNGGGILELATGSGKTLICAILSHIYSQIGKVVVIVPNIDLVLQTQIWFDKLGIDTGIWYGESKNPKHVTVSTWQSLSIYPELLGGVKCVIVDEVHQSKAKTLQEILTGPAAKVPFRFGCSGTIPKEDLFRKQIIGAIGEIIFSLPSWELQEKGILAKSHITQIMLDDCSNPSYIKNIRNDSIQDWADEVNWMFTQTERWEYIADMIKEVTEQNNNSLVLVQYRKQGKKLQELIPNAVSLDGRNKDRKEIYDIFNKENHNVLICTTGIASTGIDIPRIYNLFIIEPGKKFEKIIQILGRGLRKAEDKDSLNVFDICGNSSFSKTHANKRRTLYKGAKHDFERIKVDYNVDVNS